MILPEPDYISLKEASEKFDVSIEHLRWLAEQLKLNLYVREPFGARRYAKLEKPIWNIDTLEYSVARFLDNKLNEETEFLNGMYVTGWSYSTIMIRPSELHELDQSNDNVSEDSHLFDGIVISSEETTIIDKTHKEETGPISHQTNNSESLGIAKDNQNFFASLPYFTDFDINMYVAQKREEKGCKLTSCFNCKEKSCRSHLAHDLFTNYGFHTQYRKYLIDIGVALGCASPKRAVDKDDKEQTSREKKEVDAVKSQTRRWIADHKLK